MSTPGPFSLDHLHVLLTVAETGSFAAAARRLNRANSAISYAIDTLESQLGLPLFDRGTTRRPLLTREGEAVVSEARSVAYGADMLRARVKGLLEGLEAEVSLAVDEMFPAERLVELMTSFRDRFPTVPVRLNTDVLGGIERLVRGEDSCIGIGGMLHMEGEGLTRFQLEGVRMIPVAAPGHPFARKGKTRPGLSREHLQLVLTEQPVASGRDYGVVGAQVWRVGGLGPKHQLLLAGLGWGGMPEPMVRADIEAGRLVHLDLPDWRGGEYALQVVHRNDAPPGPAGRWLIERLVEQARPKADQDEVVPRGGMARH